MNLFMLLGQLGLSYELSGQQLLPIGTVYDPFVCRGLDALIYASTQGRKFVFAGTPSGVSLSPEGGAHQSTVTAVAGHRVAGAALLRAGLRARSRVDHARRLARNAATARAATLPTCASPPSGRPTPAGTGAGAAGPDELRRQVLAGGYRLLEGRAGGAASHRRRGGADCRERGHGPRGRRGSAPPGRRRGRGQRPARDQPRSDSSPACGRRADASDATCTPAATWVNWTCWSRRTSGAPRSSPYTTPRRTAWLSWAASTAPRPYRSASTRSANRGHCSEVYRAVGIGVDDIVAAAFLALDLRY